MSRCDYQIASAHFCFGTAMWVELGTRMWGIKKAKPKLDPFRKVLSCGRNGHTAPLISQESSTKNKGDTPCSLHPLCVYLADFCAANNLHRILLPTTAHTPLDAWRKPFYNRPSDCCFRLAYSVVLLIPITIRTIAPESVGW